MVRVFCAGRFMVYVYAEGGQPHHKPHCYIYWADGDASVGREEFDVLDGPQLPRNALRLRELRASRNLSREELAAPGDAGGTP